jgi:hypothetical protein
MYALQGGRFNVAALLAGGDFDYAMPHFCEQHHLQP